MNLAILSTSSTKIEIACGAIVNADGALHTYHSADWGPKSEWRPKDRAPLGLDAPENGGKPIWSDGEVVAYKGWGFHVVDGQPTLQKSGYYVSTTSLENEDFAAGDPRRYFDAANLPGWTLPRDFPAHLGDLALLRYGQLRIWAICCDHGKDSIELSPAACEALKIPSNARHGGVEEGVFMTVLRSSHTQYRAAVLTAAQIQDQGNRLVNVDSSALQQ